MRVLLLLTALALAGCGNAAPVEQPAHGMPSVADLDRMASAAGSPFFGETIASGGNYEPGLLGGGGAFSWAIQRFGPLLERAGIDYTVVTGEGGSSFEPPPGLWSGVADFNHSRWVYRDLVGAPMFLPPPFDEEKVTGYELAPTLDVLSAAGYLYFVVLSTDEQVEIDETPILSWEIESPFLGAPGPMSCPSYTASSADLEVAEGTDHQYADYWDSIRIYRCEGLAFDEGSAEEAGSLTEPGPGGKFAMKDSWPDPAAPPYTYAAAYFIDDVRVSEWTAPLNVAQ